MKLLDALKRWRKKRTVNSVLGYFLGSGDLDDLHVSGYSSLSQSPDVAACVEAIASIVGAATICLMRNTPDGDIRVHDRLARFVDITPYSLGTRKSWVEWIVTTLLTTGNACVLPVTEGGLLRDLVPMPGATLMETPGVRYQIQWKENIFDPGDVLHFVRNPDHLQPWRGRPLHVQLRDILQNLKQAAATTNAFMSSKWRPSVVVKVDALSDEFDSKTGREKLLEQYIENDKAGAPWIIPAGLLDVQTITPLSLADLAIHDSVQLDRRSVAAALGAPPFLLGLGEYRAEDYNGFIRRTVVPLATGIAQELSRKLLLSPDMYFKFSTRRLYAYSLQELAGVGDDQYVRGIMSGNEVRDWLDLSPRENLDDLVLLENYIPRGMIADQKKLKGDPDDGNI